MLLSRANLGGGRTLKGFPLEEENGQLGYKLGYCSNCNEQILIKSLDTRLFSAKFQMGEEEYKSLLKKLSPKLNIKERLIKWLGGYVASQAVENY